MQDGGIFIILPVASQATCVLELGTEKILKTWQISNKNLLAHQRCSLADLLPQASQPVLPKEQIKYNHHSFLLACCPSSVTLDHPGGCLAAARLVYRIGLLTFIY